MFKKNNISEVMNMEHEYIIAHADKSVLKISGLEVKEKDQDTYRKYRILA